MINAMIIGSVCSLAVWSLASPTTCEIVQRKLDLWTSCSKSIATAIRAYEMDNGNFPPSVGPSLTLSDFVTSCPAAATSETLVYISPSLYQQAIIDPFANGSKLTYVTMRYPYGWFLVSPGPDQLPDISPTMEYKPYDVGLWRLILEKTYDPTNGCLSKGDIWTSEEYLDYIGRTDQTTTTFLDFLGKQGRLGSKQ